MEINGKYRIICDINIYIQILFSSFKLFFVSNFEIDFNILKLN